LPYKSKGERERELWMTLAEAIDWISKQDSCSRRAATLQIRAALADNAIGHSHLRWEDAAGDYPPIRRQFWQKASIGRGRVFDPETKRWRTLLLRKDDVFQLWPKPSVTTARSESGKTGPITKAKVRGRPNDQIEVHRALDRLSQRGLNVKTTLRKVLKELVNEECGKKWTLRTIQQHFSSWLEKHRTDA